MSAPTILLVDDHESIRVAIADFLESSGFEVVTAAGVAEARSTFRARMPDAALLDYNLQDGDALQLLGEMRALDPACAIVILTGQGSIDLAVRAMQEGADHFLTKPVELPTLRVVLARLLELKRAQRTHEAAAPRQDPGEADPFLGSRGDPTPRRPGAAGARGRPAGPHPRRDREWQGGAGALDPPEWPPEG